VRTLPTRFGALDFTLCAEEEDRVLVGFGGSAKPPGGVVLHSPFARPLRDAIVDGRRVEARDPQRLHLAKLPVRVVLRYREAHP